MFYGNRLAINQLANSMVSPTNYLLKGPKGTGKYTLAYEFSKILLNATCSLENNPDFYLIQKDRTIKKEDVLFIKQECSIYPIKGDKKIFLIDNADTATPEAQNSLLKVLEDSFPFNIFILVAHTSMLSTIESRLSPITFSSIEPIEYRKLIESAYFNETTIDEFQKDVICAATQGCFGKAQKIIDIIEDFSNPFGIYLKNIGNKTKILDAFGMLSEKKETGFYFNYSDCISEIISVLQTIILDIIKAKNGLSNNMEFYSCQEYLETLSCNYTYSKLELIQNQLYKDELLIKRKNYDKNAFFETINIL